MSRIALNRVLMRPGPDRGQGQTVGNMRKILVVTELYPESAHNVTRSTLAIHNWIVLWRAKGVSVDVLRVKQSPRPTLRQMIPRGQSFPFGGAETLSVSGAMFAGYALALSWLVRRMLRRRGWGGHDLVLVHGGNAVSVARWMLSSTRAKVAIGVHLDNFRLTRTRHPFAYLHQRALVRKAVLCGFRSYPIRTAMQRDPTWRRCPAVPAFSGVNPAFLISKDALDDRLVRHGRSDSSVSIVTVARLVSRKRVIDILRALTRLPLGFTCDLHIVGDGPVQRLLQSVAASIENAEPHRKIIFHGWLRFEQLRSVLWDADVFCLVSEWETFGLVYLEAMAAGLVPIGVQGEGPDGIIEHGTNGYLVPARDPSAIATALHTISSSLKDGRIRGMAHAARSTAERHTEESAAASYLYALMQAHRVVK